MRIGLFLAMLLTFGCIKDEGKITKPNLGSGDTSGSGGGNPVATDDPLAVHAWHLENTGQNSFSASGGIAGEDINVKAVHSILDLKGRNVKIAISDTGVEITHPDLSANALAAEHHRNYVFTSSTRWAGAAPDPTNNDYHGTGVTGLAAAAGWNGIGSRGVAPSAKFAAFRYIFDYSASETEASLLAKELDQMNGNFDIFNYSYGYNGAIFVNVDSKVFDGLEYGATQLRSGKGAIYVQSSGNSYAENYSICTGPTVSCQMKASGNTNAHADMASPHKIIVAAVNAMGISATYSSPGSGVWVSAAGGEYGDTSPAMITTDLTTCSSGASFRDLTDSGFNYSSNSLNLQCNYSNLFNGTSSAAPVLSGVVALMLEANPNLTWRDIKHILATSSEVIDYDPIFNTLTHPRGFDLFSYVYDVKWTRNSVGIYFSNWYGFGRVDALAAVQRADSYVSSLGTYEKTLNTVPNPDQWYYDSGSINLAIPDEDATGVEDRIWVGHDFSIEAIQIQLTTDHNWPGDLAVHLTSPSGTESRLLLANNNIYSEGLDPNTLLLSNAFYGERSVGYWKIKIVDGSSAITTMDGGSITGTGSLTNWKILVHGHRTNTNLPYPVTSLSMASTSISATATPVFSFAHTISLSSLNRYEVAIGTTPGGTNVKDWTSLGTANTSQIINGLTLADATTHYLSVRAINQSGQSSSIQVKSWVPDF